MVAQVTAQTVFSENPAQGLGNPCGDTGPVAWICGHFVEFRDSHSDKKV